MASKSKNLEGRVRSGHTIEKLALNHYRYGCGPNDWQRTCRNVPYPRPTPSVADPLETYSKNKDQEKSYEELLKMINDFVKDYNLQERC